VVAISNEQCNRFFEIGDLMAFSIAKIISGQLYVDIVRPGLSIVF